LQYCDAKIQDLGIYANLAPKIIVLMNLFKSFSSYALINMLNAAIPFLLLPVLTTYLSPADYGLLTNFDVFTRFTLPFIILGINGAINTAFFRLEKEKFPSYFSSALSVSMVATGIVAVLFLMLSPLILKYIQIPFHWIMIVPVYCFLQTLTTVTMGLFQMKKQPQQFGKYLIGMTLLNFGLSLLFVALLKWSWGGRLLGLILTYFSFAVISVFVFLKFKLLRKTVSKEHVKDVLKFGIPLIPHLIAGPLIQFSDRFFITHYVGLGWAGIYNVAFQIGTSIALITVAFNQAYVPYLYEKLASITEDAKRKIVKQSYLIMLLFLVMVFVLWVATPLIFKIFINSRFAGAQQFILLISCGSAFGGMYFLVTNYIFYEKKTYLLTWVTLSNALLSLLLNSILTRHYGAWGAAITFCVTNAFIFISVWVLSNKVYPMPWFSFWKQNKVV
jgi:O-antigen/teichoic acid export membrane protein